MQDRLAQVDRARKDFIANASHELRTPLFSLGGFLELLSEEDLDAATREEFVLTMREQVRRLTKLATDLLDLSRLDSGAVEVGASRSTWRRRPGRWCGSSAGWRPGTAAGSCWRGRPAAAARDRRRAARAADRPGAGRQRRAPQPARHRGAGPRGRRRRPRQPDGVRRRAGHRPRFATASVRAVWRGPQGSSSGSGLGLAIARELAQRMDGEIAVSSDDGQKSFALRLQADGLVISTTAARGSSSRATISTTTSTRTIPTISIPRKPRESNNSSWKLQLPNRTTPNKK